MFREVEEGENEEEREALRDNGAMEGTEEEQWRQLAGEIIELSDDENFMEEGDEEDDEDDLVCVENGEGGNSSSQVMFVRCCRTFFVFRPWYRRPAPCKRHHTCKNPPSQRRPGTLPINFISHFIYTCSPCSGNNVAPPLQVTGDMLSCKACAAPLPADPAAVRRHADTHLTELGLCRVCGASFPDRAAGFTHSLSHVGVHLFTCDMCHLQFCSKNKLLRHHRQTSSGYTIPQGALTHSSHGPSAELQCAVCAKTLGKDFQVGGHLIRILKYVGCIYRHSFRPV